MFIPHPDNKNAKKQVLRAEQGPHPAAGLLRPNLTDQDISKLKGVLSHSDAQFFIVPTPKLRDCVAEGKPEFVKQIDQQLKIALLEGYGIRIDRQMIIDWIDRKLDPFNSFLLDYSDIRVEGSSAGVPGGAKNNG